MLTARVPNKVTILLTHRCNQSCEFCFDASQVIGAVPKHDIAMETVDALLDVIRASAIPGFNVTLSGGEPTLHPRLLDILEHVSAAGCSSTILTNGQRLADARFMDDVLRYDLHNLQFSIEGATAEVHDERVGCKGAWGRAVRAIENAQARGVRFITNSTLTPQYAEEMFRIIDLLAELGVPKMSVGNMLPEGGGCNRAMLCEYPDVVEYAERLTLYALTREIAFSFITPLPACLKRGRVVSNPSVCSAGGYSIVMDTDGTLRACSVSRTPGPNVRELRSFRDASRLLEPAVIRELHERVPAECRACPTLADCRAACPMYWQVPGARPPSAWASALAGTGGGAGRADLT
jgi:radical SAM protein with 4Fe4S-binding SPASM domain